MLLRLTGVHSGTLLSSLKDQKEVQAAECPPPAAGSLPVPYLMLPSTWGSTTGHPKQRAWQMEEAGNRGGTGSRPHHQGHGLRSTGAEPLAPAQLQMGVALDK